MIESHCAQAWDLFRHRPGFYNHEMIYMYLIQNDMVFIQENICKPDTNEETLCSKKGLPRYCI